MIKINRAMNDIIRFMDSDVLPHLTGAKKIGAAAYVALASRNIESVIKKYKDHPALAMLDIIHDDEIDVDALYNAIAPRFNERISMDVPLLGTFTFSRGDLDKLYAYMKS